MLRSTHLLGFFLLMLVINSCRSSHHEDVDISIAYTPPISILEELPSPFQDLTANEKRQDWGKEFQIGISLGREHDLYRAITAFKRSLVLLPPAAINRRLEIEYCIAISYYLGKKYCNVIETFENGPLLNVTKSFPAFETLLIILHDSYLKTNDKEKADKVINLLENYYPETARDLKLSTALSEGHVQESEELAATHPSNEFLIENINSYKHQTKSPNRAKFLNAVFPGAGYLYVEQKQSALTSFLLNGLFIWATVHFFDHGHTAAGLITAGFEIGWYFGGIHGAGNAAEQYNERLWEKHAKRMLFQKKLYPALIFKYVF